MKRKEEIKYLKILLKEIDSSLKAYGKKGKQDKLHEFRVGIKKLKAFLILADSAYPKSKLLKKFRPVGRVFRRAGKIRNAAINIENTSQPSLKKEQHTLLLIADGKFKLNGQHYRQQIKQAGTRLMASIGPINNLHISLFYEKHLQQIASFFEHCDFSSSLHEYRKQLKTLMYNYRLVGPLLDIKLNETYIDRLQQAIGDWHDNAEAALNAQPNTVLARRQQQSKAMIADLVVDFYEQATKVNEIAIAQID